MHFKYSYAFFIGVVLLFADSIGNALAADDMVSILAGKNTKDLRVLIRNIDGGEVLWAKNYTLDTQASIQPGPHQVSVMCEFRHSWGNELLPGNVSLQVEANKTYVLSGIASTDGKTCVVAASQSGPSEHANPTSSKKSEHVTEIDIDVRPYYEAARAPGEHPTVAVGAKFNDLLSSNKQEDIVAVRDLISAEPQLITPMTLMVLSIRLYDVGLRDEAVFWYYVAKDRYITLSDVVEVRSPALAQVEDAVSSFFAFVGPVINSYAFCDISKQQGAQDKAIDWVEKNPYQAVFLDQLTAKPGDRRDNLKASVAVIRGNNKKAREYISNPKNLQQFNKDRSDNNVPAQYCWK